MSVAPGMRFDVPSPLVSAHAKCTRAAHVRDIRDALEQVLLPLLSLIVSLPIAISGNNKLHGPLHLRSCRCRHQSLRTLHREVAVVALVDMVIRANAHNSRRRS